MTTTTTEALMDFRDTLNTTVVLGEALNMSPCEALAMAFPAVVADDDVMGALATMLDPAITEVAALVADPRPVTPEEGEAFLHNVFHLLQVAAALGHTLGVHQTIGGADDDIPDTLADIPWANLPDVLGDEDQTREEEV